MNAETTIQEIEDLVREALPRSVSRELFTEVWRAMRPALLKRIEAKIGNSGCGCSVTSKKAPTPAPASAPTRQAREPREQQRRGPGQRPAAQPGLAPVRQEIRHMPGDLRAVVDVAELAAAVDIGRRAYMGEKAMALVGADGAGHLHVAATMWSDHGFPVANAGWIVASMPATVSRVGSVACSVSQLSNLLRARDGQVEIVGEDGALVLRYPGGGVIGRVRSVDGSGFPPGEVRTSTRVTWDAGRLADAIEATAYTASKDEARVNLHCVVMERSTRGAGTSFVSTDGHRLSLFEAETLAPPATRILVPLAVADRLTAILPRAGAVMLESDGDGWQVLSAAGGRVPWSWFFPGLRVVFPPYDRVIPSLDTLDLSCTTDGPVLARALRRLASYAGDPQKTSATVWDFGDRTLRIGFKSGMGNGVEAAVDVPIECGEHGTGFVGISIVYAAEALEAPAHAGRVRVSMQTPKPPKNRGSGWVPTEVLDPVRFDASGPGWASISVVMPMRIAGDRPAVYPSPVECGPAATREQSIGDPIDWRTKDSVGVEATRARFKLSAQIDGAMLAAATRILRPVVGLYADLNPQPGVALVADRGRVVLTTPTLIAGARVELPARVSSQGVAHASADALLRTGAALETEACVAVRLETGHLTANVGTMVFSLSDNPSVLPLGEDEYHLEVGQPRLSIEGELARRAFEASADFASGGEFGVRVEVASSGATITTSDGAMLLNVQIGHTDQATASAFTLSAEAAGALAGCLRGQVSAVTFTEPENRRATVYGEQDGVEWAVQLAASERWDSRLSDLVRRFAERERSLSCTVDADPLRKLLPAIGRAAEAEGKRRKADYRTSHGRRLPRDPQKAAALAARVRMDVRAGALTLSIDGSEGETWRLPLVCAAPDASLSLTFDPARLKMLLGTRLFAGRELRIEAFGERDPFFVSVSDDNWDALAALQPLV